MPTPVSLTVNRTPPSTLFTPIVMVPFGVNFKALEMRFLRITLILLGSERIS